MLAPDGMHAYYHCAEKGLQRVGIWSRQQPDRVIEGFDGGEFDAEGATSGPISAICRSFRSICPPGSSSPERQAAKFAFLTRFFPKCWPCVAKDGRSCCVATGISPTGNRPEELEIQPEEFRLPARGAAWLSKVFDEVWAGSTFYRRLHPEATGEAYTWWSNRGQAWAKNVGWRIDYQIATPGIAATAIAAQIYKAERFPIMRR